LFLVGRGGLSYHKMDLVKTFILAVGVKFSMSAQAVEASEGLGTHTRKIA
jgi:hypothetical protein